VFEDYGWLGNQVDISGAANKNKFYRGQVVQKGSNFYSWTRWGRVGEYIYKKHLQTHTTTASPHPPFFSSSSCPLYLSINQGENGQNNLDGPYASSDKAVAAFSKKFKDKTGYNWAGNQGDYPGGKKGKYSVIFEAFDNKQSSVLAAAAGNGGGGGAEQKVKYEDPKIDGELAEFVRLVTDQDMFKSQLASMGVDTAKMPLGDISKRTVEEGFKALIAVEEYLKAGGGPQLADLCSVFYTYIPHAFGRSKAPLLKMADIQAKKVSGRRLIVPFFFFFFSCAFLVLFFKIFLDFCFQSYEYYNVEFFC
jgi:poly [ADP-ribose] polymerase 2/3/4